MANINLNTLYLFNICLVLTRHLFSFLVIHTWSRILVRAVRVILRVFCSAAVACCFVRRSRAFSASRCFARRSRVSRVMFARVAMRRPRAVV
jgi:hypothetical protein